MTVAIIPAGVAIGSAVPSGTSKSVVYIDSNGNLAQDNASFYWNDSILQLNLVRGTTTSSLTEIEASGRLRINNQITSSAVLNRSFAVWTEPGAGAALNGQFAGLEGDSIIKTGDTNVYTGIGLVGLFYQSIYRGASPGSLTSAYGVNCLAGTQTGSGTLTNGIAGYFKAGAFSGTGTCTNAYGIYIDSAPKGTSATLTNNIGIAINSQTNGTNIVYLLIGTVTAPTGSWAIYSSSTLASQLSGLLSVAQGKSTSFAKVGGMIFDHYADAGSSGTSETDLYSDTIPASALGTNGDKLVATYGCTLVNSTSTKEVKVYFGGTVIFDTGALTISASSEITIYALIIRDSSTSVRYSVSANTTGASTGTYSSVGKITGLTLSNTQILKITGQAGGVGAADNDIVAILGTVEWKSAA